MQNLKEAKANNQDMLAGIDPKNQLIQHKKHLIERVYLEQQKVLEELRVGMEEEDEGQQQ